MKVRSLTLFLLCTFLFAYVPASAAGGTTAEPPEAALVRDPEVLALLDDLFAKAGRGAHDIERAAFLTVENGRYACLLWPMRAAFRSESYNGVIPAGTIAIIHTHPNGFDRASSQDRKTAMQTGLPLLTITWASISMIDPSTGEEKWLVKREKWRGRIDLAKVREDCECREIGTPPRKPLPGSLVAERKE